MIFLTVIPAMLVGMALGWWAALGVWPWSARWARIKRWWRAPQVLLPGALFRRRNTIAGVATNRALGVGPIHPPAKQDGPPTRRCRATTVRRGRCLREPNHPGDCLFPVDIGLPAS